MQGPNPLSVGWSVLTSLRNRRPAPTGTAAEPDHTTLAGVLAEVEMNGLAGLTDQRRILTGYVEELAALDPDGFDRAAALAYWLNLYNAGALMLAGDAFASGQASVLRVPGGFTAPVATVAGEELSLSAIEHGKIRRFKDPRIHGALVCGSASCPTLRYEPYRGAALDSQLDSQLRSFLKAGGAVLEDGTMRLSRVFLWYGADFVRPSRMPAFLPATRRQVANALSRWLPAHLQPGPDGPTRAVAFQRYDWGLACAVTRPE